MPAQTATPAILDHIAKRIRVCRLANNTHIGNLIIRHRPFDHPHGAVDSITFFITGDQQTDRPANTAFDNSGGSGNERSNPALHIGSAAPEQRAVNNVTAKRVPRPGRGITNRHNICVTGKTDMWRSAAITRKQIVDAIIALAKGQARAGKPDGRQLCLEKVDCPAFGRGYRRTADQPLRQINCMRLGVHQSRSRSLTDVFDRVFSSTCLMITAQDKDGPGVPSASGLPGNVPGTTTE